MKPTALLFSLLLALAGCSDLDDKFPSKDAGLADSGDKLDQKVTPDHGAGPDLKLKPDAPPKLDLKLKPDAPPKPDMKLKPDLKLKPDAPPKPDLKLKPDAPPKPDMKLKPDLPAGWCTKNAECDDKLTCTTDTCAAGKCTNKLATGNCLINKACYKNGTINPSMICEQCVSTLKTTAWTTRPKCVYTVAGTGKAGYKDGSTKQAQFNGIWSLAATPSGTLFVGDTLNYRVRMVAGGKVTTLAGSGAVGSTNGPAASAKFHGIRGLEVDSAGKVYVGDYKNFSVRLVHGGAVSTFAGAGVQGYADGPVTTAKFSRVFGVATDNAGTLYVADGDNNRIRVVSGGKVTTLAGSGTAGFADGAALSAKFNLPTGVAVDSAGKVYVADYFNHSVRMIHNGKVSTLAGTGTAGFKGGKAGSAMFNTPTHVAVGKAGDVFVADHKNNRVRLISNGVVTTYAGGLPTGYADGPLATAKFNGIQDMAMDSKGNLYVAELAGAAIRCVTPP